MKILVLLYGGSRANRESAKATKHRLPTVIGWECEGHRFNSITNQPCIGTLQHRLPTVIWPE